MDFMYRQEFDLNLRDEWNALLHESVSDVPFLQFDYLRAWWKHLGGGEWKEPVQLVIVTAYEDDHLVGIAPCFATRHEARNCLMLLGSYEISDFLDLIVRAEDAPRFIQGLMEFVRNDLAAELKLEALDFYNLLDQSPSLPLLQASAQSQGWTAEVKQLQHSPYIQLSGDWETYLAGIDKKQRHEIRRKMRRADESEFPVAWHVVENESQLNEESEIFLDLMYQDEDKQAFLTPLMRVQMKEIMRKAYENGCLQLAFLTVNGSAAAAYLNFDYGNRIWVYNSGLDYDYMDFSPGWVLLGHLLKWANEKGKSEFDFMRGAEDYKYKFGAIDRFVMRMTIRLNGK